MNATGLWGSEPTHPNPMISMSLILARAISRAASTAVARRPALAHPVTTGYPTGSYAGLGLIRPAKHPRQVVPAFENSLDRRDQVFYAAQVPAPGTSRRRFRTRAISNTGNRTPGPQITKR